MSVKKVVIAYQKAIGALKGQGTSLATLNSAEFAMSGLRRAMPIAYLIEMIDTHCGLHSNDDSTSNCRLQVIMEIAEQVRGDLQPETRILLNTWARAGKSEQSQIYPKLSALLIEHEIDLESTRNDSGEKKTATSDHQPKPAMDANYKAHDWSGESQTNAVNTEAEASDEQDWTNFKSWGIKHFRDGTEIQSRVIHVAEGCRRYADFVAWAFTGCNSTQQNRGFNAFLRDAKQRAEKTDFTFELKRDGNDLVLLPLERKTMKKTSRKTVRK